MEKQAPPDTITTSRLRLRAFPQPPIEAEEKPSVAWQHALDFFFAVRTDPATAQWSFEGKPDASREVTQEWMRRQAVLTWCYLIEVDDESHTKTPQPNDAPLGYPIIGSVDLKLPSEKSDEYRSKEVEIAYFLSGAYRGKGYATEACGALVDAFWKHEDEQGNNEWKCMDGMTDSGNLPSRRVLEKLGFQVFKVFERNHENKLLGGWRDLEQWRIARPTGSTDDA